jgi:hypothetical protein
MTVLQFMHWVSDRVGLAARFIRLGTAGVFTPEQIIQRFTKLLLAIARYLPESHYAVILWGLDRVQRFA